MTQLINKTNQFNLTTRRRSEAEVAALAADPESTVLAFAVDDRFGEYGIVGVTISRQAASQGWELDTVLMSCRVLGRGVETAMLAETIAALRRARPSHPGHRPLRRPTDRNAMVADAAPRSRIRGDAPGRRRCVRRADDSCSRAEATIDVPAHITRRRTVIPVFDSFDYFARLFPLLLLLVPALALVRANPVRLTLLIVAGLYLLFLIAPRLALFHLAMWVVVAALQVLSPSPASAATGWPCCGRRW